jgi:hypothetical protein
MKVSLALGSREPLSRQTAWGCLTGNLALPGSGSLVAGRRAGYFQLALAGLGMVLTMIFGLRFIFWFFANWSRLHQPSTDPFAILGEMWQVVRWAAFGIGVFLVSWLWALGTSYRILHSTTGSEQSNVPPRFY